MFLLNSCFRYSKECYPIPASVPFHKPNGEFLRVLCISNAWPLFNDVVYRDFFALPNPDLRASEKIASWKTKTVAESEKPPNIVILMLDTNSRLNSHRRLPKTLRLLKSLGAVEMLGYTKTGANTFPNTLSFLAGMNRNEFMTSCVDNDKVPYTFDNCSLLWNDFGRAGYLTVTAEDSPGSNGFNFNKGGFRVKPTDFSYRTFTLIAMDRYKWPWEHHWFGRCIGGTHSAKKLLNYAQDILKGTSQGTPVFVHAVLSAYSHECTNAMRFEDNEIAEFVAELDKKNTVLFLMGDHGDHYGAFRDTMLGWYEEKLPAMFIYLPDRLKLRFPNWNATLNENSKRLSSHFDLYWTLVEILENFNKSIRVDTPPSRHFPKIGKSLFEPLPENRTCADAGIEVPHCACTQPTPVDLRIENELKSSKYWKAALTAINFFAHRLPPQCAQPVMRELISAKVMNYSESTITYIVQFYTDPGKFKFEASVRVDGGVSQMSVDRMEDITRINKLTRKVDCLRDAIFELYCYCL